MATPPVFQAEYESVWNTATTPKSVTPTTSVGDIMVVLAGDEDGSAVTINTPTGNSLTYTLAQSIAVANASGAYAWTAPDNTGGAGWTLQDTASVAGGQFWGFTSLRFSGHGGVGASSKTNLTSPTTGAPSLNITTQADNSAIVVVNVDFAAADGTTRTWRTVNGITPTIGNGLEVVYFRDAIRYTVYAAYYSDAGAAGTKTVGLTAPSAQTYSIIAVEIKGAAVAGGGISFRPGKTWQRRYKHRQRLPTVSPVAVVGDFTADASTTVTEADTVSAVVGKVGSITGTVTSGGTVTGVAGAVGAVSATVTASDTVSATVTSGVVGSVTATVTAGGTVTAVVGAVGAVSATVTCGSTVTAVVGRMGAVTATVTCGSTVTAVVGKVGTVTATVTCGSTVTAAVTSGPEVISTVTAGSTVSGVIGKIGAVTATVTAGPTVTAVRAITAGVTGTVTVTSTVVPFLPSAVTPGVMTPAILTVATMDSGGDREADTIGAALVVAVMDSGADQSADMTPAPLTVATTTGG